MKNIFILLFLTFSLGIFSQIEDPLKWATSVEKISDTEFVLVSTATIDDGWHLYAQDVPEDGPIATSFTFENTKNNYLLKGNTTEQEGVTIDDPVFEMKIKFFENSATFKQTIQTKTDLNYIRGVVEFMVCDDTRCLAPTEIELVFNLKKEIDSSVNENKVPIRIDNKEVNAFLYGMNTSDITFSSNKCKDEVLSSSTEIQKGDKSLWNLFGLGFLGGLLALLTPCVFPMIPLTVSFFTKKIIDWFPIFPPIFSQDWKKN